MHLAIIMDGNGRWATLQGKNRSSGHKAGMKKVIETVEWADATDISVLTLYAFSTENWQRPKQEVSFLMELLVLYIERELGKLIQKNAKIRILGDVSCLPERCRFKLHEAVDATSKNTGLLLNFAINYSGRDELVRAMKQIRESGVQISNYGEISAFLDTRDLPDPDIIFRTGGHKRLSNFLLLQSAYAELIFSDVLWPDITTKDLDACLNEYQQRTRNFGGLR